MKCADAGRDMFAFLDGAVTVETNLEVLQHLNVCAACARRFEAEKRVEAGVGRALRDEPTPAGFRGRLDAALDRADAETAAGAPAARPGLRLLRGGRLGWMVAAAAVLVLAVLAADYACVGPFQCPVILAATEAAEATESQPSPPRASVITPVDLSEAGLRCENGVCTVDAPSLEMQGQGAAYACPDGSTVCLVSLDLGDHDPKPGNRVVDDAGRSWYEASVGDRRVRAWKDGPLFRALVTRSGTVDLVALSRLARR